MGCILCSITSCEEFIQGDRPSEHNIFYCKTKKEREDFLEELAYDIAATHPEMVRKINRYVKKLRKNETENYRVCWECIGGHAADRQRRVCQYGESPGISDFERVRRRFR